MEVEKPGERLGFLNLVTAAVMSCFKSFVASSLNCWVRVYVRNITISSVLINLVTIQYGTF